MSKIQSVVAVVGDDEREGRGNDGELLAGVEWSGRTNATLGQVLAAIGSCLLYMGSLAGPIPA